jgi:hypothetical protein
MTSQNVKNHINCKEDPGFYLEEDPVNLVVARTEVVAESVDKTADKMGDQFRKFIKCAKYQDIESKDYEELVDTITLVQKQLETLKIYLCCTKILIDNPEA